MHSSSIDCLVMPVAPDPSIARMVHPRVSVESVERRPIALITGATDGIGRAVAHRVAGLVDTLLIHGRCAEPLTELAATLAPAHPGTSIVPVMAELASFSDVDRLIQRIRTTYDRLDILINNAATAGQYPRIETEDGHELAFQVNYLSPVMLTAGLFDLVCQAKSGRIVNVVCDLYRHAAPFQQDSVHNGRYHPVVAYAKSKLALVAHTASVAGALVGSTCGAVCVDPGIAETKLQRKTFGWPGSPVSAAADNVLYAVTMPQNDGGFYIRGKKLVQPEPEVLQPAVQRQFDRIAAELLDMRFPWSEQAAAVCSVTT
jgi:NAD(P)-dependent dehydrogenase (short-subunit alcohol dehydrogenase family)